MDEKWPEWFRLDPDGEHKKSGGLDADGYSLVWFCAKDGEPWPCPTECERSRS